MKTKANKPNEGKIQAAASDHIAQLKTSSTLQFKDNRPEATFHNKMQEIASKSKPIKQFQVNRSHLRNSTQMKAIHNVNSNVVQFNPFSRITLGKSLMSGIFSSSNPFARSVFKTMNAAMWLEGQPITQDHYRVLDQSLLHNNDGLLDTLIAENPHVMKSTGRTPIYLMGKYMVHKPLEWYINKRED